MLSRLLARLVLAAALLAAWQTALVHPLVHVDDHGRLVHVGHEHGSKSDPSDLCDALAAVAVCVSDGSKALVEAISTQKVLRRISGTLLAADAPPFLSQGPPT